MATNETKEGRQSTTEVTPKKLSCNGRTCLTCGKCCDWRFTGDAPTAGWICNYQSWGNDDWKRWRRNRMWKLYERIEDGTCTSVSHGSGSTFDDPIFGGHHVTHTVDFCAGHTIKASHDFLFVGDHIPADQHIISSVGDLCVCNINNK
ncbi:unnamed protein product [Adineta steineri]|uniref:Uncharacterized protein n=1 Tax=Adineta steineri TaxID=433720 RepID=A0A819H939_9BILA|nr:unnamed protein product [Adineta steineri]CAF0769422.1 unnamed protein product [Adineta steineri]CAF3657809.1 unnamed protein product [Adineta steineri]CAF3898089.1 unnamed protein product [Adineta steineri]